MQFYVNKKNMYIILMSSTSVTKVVLTRNDAFRNN